MDAATLTALDSVHAGATAAEHESEHLDFKQEDPAGEKQTLKKLAYASTCFANGAGGDVVLGVVDRANGPDAFAGTALSADLVKREIWNRTTPSLAVGVEELDFRGHRLLVIHVPESPDIHADPQGRAPRRIGTACYAMSPQEQQRLLEDRRGIDWSREPSTRAVDATVRAAVEIALSNLGRHRDPERRALSRLEPRQLLRKLGVVRSDDKLTNAGEALFCSTIDGAERLVYIYKETAGGEAVDVHRFDDPLIIAFERVMQIVEGRRRLTPVTLSSGQQIQIEDFPHLAVREALSNAVMHRDYRISTPVTVVHSPQSFEVTSPGPLVSGVTQSNILTHESKPRNAGLAKAARLLGLAEEIGAGVDRMYRELLSSGKDVPVIEADPDHVRITFVGHARSTRIPFYIAQLPEHEREDVDTLLTLFTLCDRRTVDAEAMAPLLQKSVDSAEAVLDRLSDDAVGMIEATRGTARRTNPKYRLREGPLSALGTAVKYNRRAVDETDRKVIAHVQEYGRITNKTIRNIFSVDVQRAKDILVDLVKRDILVRTSEARRGPTVEYGPGPKFPKGRKQRKAPTTGAARRS